MYRLKQLAFIICASVMLAGCQRAFMDPYHYDATQTQVQPAGLQYKTVVMGEHGEWFSSKRIPYERIVLTIVELDNKRVDEDSIPKGYDNVIGVLPGEHVITYRLYFQSEYDRERGRVGPETEGSMKVTFESGEFYSLHVREGTIENFHVWLQKSDGTRLDSKAYFVKG